MYLNFIKIVPAVLADKELSLAVTSRLGLISGERIPCGETVGDLGRALGAAEPEY